MKKFFRAVLVVLLMIVLFRGPVYRFLVNYRIAEYRPITVLPDARLQYVSDSLQRESENLDDFVFRVQQYTAKKLHFRTRNSGQSASRILAGGEANCVGYARVAADLLQRNAHQYPNFRVRHGIAKMALFGFDLHSLFASPFFRDHDVVEIIESRTVTLRVDPSLQDYFSIDHVNID